MVLWLLFSSAFPLRLMRLRSRMEFLDISCLHCSVCASVSPALRRSAEGKCLSVSLRGTKSYVLKVRQAPNCAFFLACVQEMSSQFE